MSILCLLPVRNCAQHLPRYFLSANWFADAILALDDGSTDDTHAMLAANPMVKRILVNPRRESYTGWDDAANRQRLLDAAAEFNPAWIVFLDADEFFPQEEAIALRRLLNTTRLKNVAFGCTVYRMLDENGNFDKGGNLWVYRIFRYAPGQRLPDRRLHFPPVSVSIPPSCLRRTTLRIQHFAGTTRERRRERYEKYHEVDPGNVFQPSYENLLEALGPPQIWVPRRPGDSILVDSWIRRLGRCFKKS